MRYYHLSYGADLTEGRGFNHICLIAIDTYPYCTMWEARLRRVAQLVGGEPIQIGMGGPMEGWGLRKSTAERWNARHEEFKTGRTFRGGEPSALFLSDGSNVSGYPDPATIYDLESADALLAKAERLGTGWMSQRLGTA